MVLAPRGGDPSVSGFEGQWGLNAGAKQDCGKQTSLLKSVCKISQAPGPRAKAVISQGPWPDLTAGLKVSPGEVGEPLWLILGT